MKFLSLFIFLFTICNYAASAETEGGLTLTEWNKKCTQYFKESGDQAEEKPFHVEGYCEQYVCQNYGNKQYGMRIDECKTRYANGRLCKRVKGVKAPYPQCCKYKCT